MLDREWNFGLVERWFRKKKRIFSKLDVFMSIENTKKEWKIIGRLKVGFLSKRKRIEWKRRDHIQGLFILPIQLPNMFKTCLFYQFDLLQNTFLSEEFSNQENNSGLWDCTIWSSERIGDLCRRYWRNENEERIKKAPNNNLCTVFQGGKLRNQLIVSAGRNEESWETNRRREL